jgi:hypothetical protein
MNENLDAKQIIFFMRFFINMGEFEYISVLIFVIHEFDVRCSKTGI